MTTWATENLTHYPGRCPTCGWHRETQGHDVDCRRRAEDPCSDTTHSPRLRDGQWNCPECDHTAGAARARAELAAAKTATAEAELERQTSSKTTPT